MPDRAIPTDPAERAEAYRTLVAGRRILVVLDNAASEQQVRPLLPGTASCAVLVTSRDRLTGIEGARRIDLDVFPPGEAIRLLARITNDNRVSTQLTEAAEIVELCGGLPLAVRIAGARLAARPGWRLAHLAAMLSDERRRLDRLVTGDLAVRTSLALSYQALDEPPRRLLRLLGLFNIPDFPAWLGAAILECSLEEAIEHAETLVDAHLLTVGDPDPLTRHRYRLHDLVRLFAFERAYAEDSAESRIGALRRGLGGWLALAERMAEKVPGYCYALIHGPAPRPPLDWAAEHTAGVDPTSWFDAERVALLAAVRQACALGLDDLAFDLAGCLEKYFDLRGMFADWIGLNTEVLAVCRTAGNRLGEAVMLRGLIDVRTWTIETGEGEAMAGMRADVFRLLDMFTELGHEPGMSDAAVMCSWALTATGAYQEAILMAARALQLAERSDYLGGQTRAQLALAVAHFEHGHSDLAARYTAQTLETARALGNPRWEATALQFSGIAHLEMGDLDTSLRMLTESLAIATRYQDTYTEVLTLLSLARLHLRRGDPQARGTAERALALSLEYRMNHHLAQALGLLGEIELADGDPVRAIGRLEESVALWRTRGWRSFQATALTSLGRAYALAGRRSAAWQALREARELFTSMGSTARAAEVEKLSQSVGDVR